MKLLVLFSLLVGCAETPPEFVPPGSTAQIEQRKADAQCVAWLAHGIDTGEEGPIVLARHPYRAPAPRIQRRGAICAFEWRANECRCFVESFENGGLWQQPGFRREWIFFNACHELHRHGEI